MPTSIDVAQYFLLRAGEESDISNLKLQKLVYYAQGFCLALRDAPLFDEPIEAWMHGPVVAALYHRYSHHGSAPIVYFGQSDTSVFSLQEQRLLDEVHEVYGQYSAWRLRQFTHEESPWKDNYKEGAFSRVIPQSEMQMYFREHLVT